jgi:flagellar motility protein MotE (MotC chaperone)
LLPLLMGAMALLLSVKIGSFWQDVSFSVGTRTEAQTQAAQTQAAQPAQSQSAGQPSPAANPGPQPAAGNAQTPQQVAAQQPAAPADAASGQGQAPAATDAAGMPAASGASAGGTDPFNYTDQEVAVLQQLSKRRTELDARARALDEREVLVAAAEQRMDQKMAELKAMQSTLQDLLKQRSAAEETQLQSLVKIYENMKPKAAAGVFEELDMDILLEVVSRMKERKVAPILALMTPTRAKELTFELAQRDQLPVTP